MALNWDAKERQSNSRKARKIKDFKFSKTQVEGWRDSVS